MRRRNRNFTPGRNGAERAPKDGLSEEEEPCNRKKCPVPATFTWTEWSSCDIDCYQPDGYRGIRERETRCEEGSPRHEFYNCDNEPGGDRTHSPCPELTECATLNRIVAKVADEGSAGTDCNVALRLRNKGSKGYCQTGFLDSKGDSWEQGDLEDFREGAEDYNYIFSQGRKEFAPCKNFFPKKEGPLEFQFVCSSSMKLSYVAVYFGEKDYAWDGKDLAWSQWHDPEGDTWHTLTHQPCPAGHTQCASLTRIRAKVADEDWAGTDCAVKLILKNRDEPFTCQTLTLDSAGSNWERNQAEDYKEEDFRKQFLPCKHFYPKPGKLQFQFTCSGSMKLTSVELDFGSTSYSSPPGLKDLDWTQWTDTWHNLY